MRERWIAKGKVQGVGFRYYVYTQASLWRVPSGYVKNLKDGSVEIVLDVDFPHKDRFLQACQKREGFISVESFEKTSPELSTLKDIFSPFRIA